MTAPKAIRRYRRFKGWDYTRGASLFITIATEPRRPLFGEIKGGRVVLTSLGEKVAEALEAYNPMKWELMYGEGGGLRVVEPLSSPRLDLGDYWKGVGNIALLSPDEKLVSLRVSREVASPAAIAAVVRRMESAVEKGYVIISGFISKGERAVRDMLARRRDAKFIRILPSCIPNRRFKPESVYIEPFAANRDLEIARGNDETEFGRRACLDLNAEIIEIATSGEGLALYWKAAGPQVLARSDA